MIRFAEQSYPAGLLDILSKKVRTSAHFRNPMNSGLVKILLEEGADVNVRDNTGKTVLMHLISSSVPGYWLDNRFVVAVTELLLIFGASLEDTNEQGQTHLHRVLCIMRNMNTMYGLNYMNEASPVMLNLVNMFIAAGIPLDSPDALGKTARDLAKEIPLPELNDLFSRSSDEGTGHGRRGHEPPKPKGVHEWCEILGCRETDSLKEIKKRYKRLVKDFHPDVIQGKELPQEFIDFAKRRFQEIQAAYEGLLKIKGGDEI